MTNEEIDQLSGSLSVPVSDDVSDLLQFCSGLEGALAEVDFTGRSLTDGFGADFLVPGGLPIAHDGCGNYWVVDVQSGSPDWGPIYYCCHDAPVMLLQAVNLQQFVSELFRRYTPPHESLIDAVREDRLFEVWRKNPGVMAASEGMESPDGDIRAFAADLDSGFELIDLRDVPIGMGFSWGRYGPRTEVRRFGAKAIFAYRKPEKRSLISKLLGR